MRSKQKGIKKKLEATKRGERKNNTNGGGTLKGLGAKNIKKKERNQKRGSGNGVTNTEY